MRKEEEVIRRMEISVCSFECIIHSYIFRCYLMEIILDSSMVEHSAVNRRVVGSSPTRGVYETCKLNVYRFFLQVFNC